jgi:hypothetical protein
MGPGYLSFLDNRLAAAAPLVTLLIYLARAIEHTPKTWTASDNTTTAELAFVLGKTFQAHSCSAHKAYIRTGWIPARQRRKGVAHARYAKNW